MIIWEVAIFIVVMVTEEVRKVERRQLKIGLFPIHRLWIVGGFWSFPFVVGVDGWRQNVTRFRIKDLVTFIWKWGKDFSTCKEIEIKWSWDLVKYLCWLVWNWLLLHLEHWPQVPRNSRERTGRNSCPSITTHFNSSAAYRLKVNLPTETGNLRHKLRQCAASKIKLWNFFRCARGTSAYFTLFIKKCKKKKERLKWPQRISSVDAVVIGVAISSIT